MARGRPKGQMTKRRQEVLYALGEQIAAGERVNYSRIARACGLYSHNDARRIVADLKDLGVVD